MKSDTQKKEKVYKISEKEYANAKRNKKRLLQIKTHIEAVHQITRQIKPD